MSFGTLLQVCISCSRLRLGQVSMDFTAAHTRLFRTLNSLGHPESCCSGSSADARNTHFNLTKRHRERKSKWHLHLD